MSDLLSNVSASNGFYQHRQALMTTAKYRAIDTEKLVTQVCQDIGLSASIEVLRSRGRTTTRHGVVIRLSTPVMLAGTECFPQIYVRNSYAGETSLRVNVGFYRLICSNGMMVGTTHFDKRIRHTQSGVDQLDLLRIQIREAVIWLTTELPILAAKLQAKILTQAQIQAVLGNVRLSNRVRSRLTDALLFPQYYVRHEDRVLGASGESAFSAWNIWNILNEQQRIGSRSQLRQLDVNQKLLDSVESVLLAA